MLRNSNIKEPEHTRMPEKASIHLDFGYFVTKFFHWIWRNPDMKGDFDILLSWWLLNCKIWYIFSFKISCLCSIFWTRYEQEQIKTRKQETGSRKQRINKLKPKGHNTNQQPSMHKSSKHESYLSLHYYLHSDLLGIGITTDEERCISYLHWCIRSISGTSYFGMVSHKHYKSFPLDPSFSYPT